MGGEWYSGFNITNSFTIKKVKVTESIHGRVAKKPKIESRLYLSGAVTVMAVLEMSFQTTIRVINSQKLKVDTA